MRIIRGGLILTPLGGNQYLVKDGKGEVKEMPVKLNKKHMAQIIRENGGVVRKKETKKDLEFKLQLLFKR
jgi:hypothetical protein